MANHGPDNPQHWTAREGFKDLVTALCILLFALGGFLFINSEGASVYPGDGGLTWRTLPFGYAGLLTLLSLIYVAQSLRKIRAERGLRVETPTPQDRAEGRIVWLRRGGSLALLLVFAAFLQVLGFAILAPVFLFALFRLYQRGHWRTDVLLSLIGGGLLWLLFVPILKMNLKGGGLDPVTPFLLNVTKAVGF